MGMTQNDFLNALLKNDEFMKGLGDKLGHLAKADTISNATNLLWYDLRPVVQMLYPFKELIPLISRLPRTPADGGNAFHWKRITGVNVNNVALGVSEGNRGARIAVSEQDQMATYKTLGLESSATFEARLGSKNLEPEALGIAVQSTLRSTMIGEEQTLLLGNANTALGTTPTPTLVASGTTGTIPTGNLYVRAVALSGFGFLQTTPYNSTTQTGGVPAQITKNNADGSVDTFGGGSAAPSAEASVAVTSGQVVTASVAIVPGAVAYAWYASTATGTEKLAGLTRGNQAIIASVPASTAQPVTALQVGGSYQDNSTNTLLPDGILSQIYGNPYGTAYSTSMGTNPTLPNNVSVSNGGSLIYYSPTGNTGLTISGTNIAEFDAILEAAYDQYKVGYSRILMSSRDISAFMGSFFGEGAASQFKILFDAEAQTGRIVAGRRVTSYLNKFFGNTLDIDIHPFVPPGTVIFWSDRVPYELSGVANILEARVRQDYYQIQWPLQSRRYEYGVYVDEVFANYFTPGFAAITNLNTPNGTPTI
ncbi:hypothetical protein P3T40_003400 [Paraburkholderia sp. EB58]|jgi:hypothetical protein|uniref:hypothetical protein n=1 Tax=Paraburkholderia sp. EB58 TaxID=3035125 RepID=UPI003D21FD01